MTPEERRTQRRRIGWASIVYGMVMLMAVGALLLGWVSWFVGAVVAVAAGFFSVLAQSEWRRLMEEEPDA